MLLVYLDWNVFVGLREGQTDPLLAQTLQRARQMSVALVPFTNEHVIEAQRGLGSSAGGGEELARRLTHIQEVTDSVHWTFESDTGRSRFSVCTPSQVHASLFLDAPPRSADVPPGPWRAELEAFEADAQRMVNSVNARIAELASMYAIDLSDLMLQAPPRTSADVLDAVGRLSEAERRAARKTQAGPLGLPSVELNSPRNGGPTTMQLIERRVEEIEGVGLQEIMAGNEQRYGGSRVHRGSQLNAVLQLAGYARDKATLPVANLSSDSSHLDFAMQADLFVTGDGRLTRRARLIAKEMGTATRILTPEEVIPVLAQHVAKAETR